MCEDSAVRAHKVVLSACSPYFQKIFVDNPGKHPIVVLKDVRCWEMQCILDFMYKGETSVPEPQLTSLIKAAESLKVRGLTSSDQLPPGVSITAGPGESQSPGQGGAGYGRSRVYSPSPSPGRFSDAGGSGQQSSPLSGAGVWSSAEHERVSGRTSPVSGGTCPRRKQARPRRRSGDSVNSSLDLSKAGSPPLDRSYAKRDSPSSTGDEQGPENLSLRRSNSPGHGPAINLVKMEQLVEDRDRRNMEPETMNISDESLDRDNDNKNNDMDRPALTNGSLHHLQEQVLLTQLWLRLIFILFLFFRKHCRLSTSWPREVVLAILSCLPLSTPPSTPSPPPTTSQDYHLYTSLTSPPALQTTVVSTTLPLVHEILVQMTNETKYQYQTYFSLFYETIPLFKRVNQPLDPQQCFPVLIPLTDMSWWPSHWLPDYSVFPLVKSQPISSLYSGCVASKNHIMTSRLGCWKTTLFYWIYIHSWICAIKSHREWLKYWFYWSKLIESLILIT